MSNTDNYVQMLADSLVMKRGVLEKLVRLNEEQKDILTADEFDGDAFQENIDKKSNLVDEINRLDSGFDNLFARVKEVLDKDKTPYASQIATIKSLIRDVTDLSVKVEAGEARNKPLAEKKFSQLRKNVSNAKSHISKTTAYHQTMNKIDYSPQFMDMKQ